MQPVVVVVKLKPGWALDAVGSAFRRGARRVPLVLPAGARVEPALRIAPAPEPTDAELELARYVHLHHPGPLADALALARGWPCTQRADLR